VAQGSVPQAWIPSPNPRRPSLDSALDLEDGGIEVYEIVTAPDCPLESVDASTPDRAAT
jgi:hypothetical protein